MSNVLVLIDGINYTVRSDYVACESRNYIHGYINGKQVSGYTEEEVAHNYADCVAQGVDCITYTGNPKDYAYTLSAVLAADKGIASDVVPAVHSGYDVITDEGKIFRIRRKL